MRDNAMKIKWEKVEVLGKEGFFTDLRVNRDSVPDGYTMYEIRHDDDCQGDPVQIANWIMVNFWGTLLVKEPFALEPASNNNAYLDIDPENDWGYTGEYIFLDDSEEPVMLTRKERNIIENCLEGAIMRAKELQNVCADDESVKRCYKRIEDFESLIKKITKI